MSVKEDFQTVQPFEVRAPRGRRSAFVFSSPHSGRHYPARFLKLARLNARQIRRSEDCYVDELFAAVPASGAPLVAANFPRAYLDVNREPFELDPRMFVEPVPPFANIRSMRVASGLGTIPRLVGEGQDIYHSRLPLAEALDRIENVYRPYHETLKTLLGEARTLHGTAVLIDCHSMPATIKSGENAAKPDFIIGDRFGASCAVALREHAISLLTSLGYTVAYNRPYAGGFITEHYGRPARSYHALQIEISRSLYLDEKTFEKTHNFGRLQQQLSWFVRELTALPLDYLDGLPLAAE